MLPSPLSSPVATASTVNKHVATAAKHLAPITLKELEAADSALMDRIDTKFLLTAHQLADVLIMVSDAYLALTIDGISLQRYHTRYLDTPDLLFYHQHHNGQRNRYKVRFRTYVDSNLSFLEVKVKNNKDRTIKSRMKTPVAAQQLTAEMQGFLHKHIPVAPTTLAPQLINTFTRLTLVNKATPERVTIDLDLRFEEDGTVSHYPHLVIAEVKQPRYTRNSPFVRALSLHRAREMGFSKYCIGVALGHPEVKHHTFKPAIMQIDRLQ